MDPIDPEMALTISRPLADGLPPSLKNCSLAVGPGPRFLQFLVPSNLVRSGDVTSSFQYHRPIGSQAMIDVIPMGGTLGKDVCTVRHDITLSGKPSLVVLPDGSQGRQYPIVDAGSMQRCSGARERRTIIPASAEPMPGLLVCRED